MKPKTKREIEVDALSKTLKPIDAGHIDKCIGKNAEVTAFSYPVRKGYTCGVCGHRFDREYVRCPHCHRKFDNYKSIKGYTEYFCEGQFDRIGDWVVERLVLIHLHHIRGKAQSAEWSEVLQRWVPYSDFAEGKVLSRNLKGAVYRSTLKSMWEGDLSLYGPLEIRRPWRSAIGNYYYSKNCYCYTPYSGYKWGFRVPKELHRRGLTAKDTEPIFTAHLLTVSPHFETIYKMGIEDLIRETRRDGGLERLDKVWPSLKIALRHGLTGRDYNYREYLDYLNMVADGMPQSKTTLSVVLPDDFDTAFQRVSGRAKAAREREDRAKYNKILSDTRAPLSERLEIANGKFALVVLTSVEDFKREGDKLHHCVYANGYYKKKDSLILSARKIKDIGTPVETIEILLGDNYRIAQCYGDHDGYSRYHKEILDLAQSGIPQIKKAMASIAI